LSASPPRAPRCGAGRRPAGALVSLGHQSSQSSLRDGRLRPRVEFGETTSMIVLPKDSACSRQDSGWPRSSRACRPAAFPIQVEQRAERLAAGNPQASARLRQERRDPLTLSVGQFHRCILSSCRGRFGADPALGQVQIRWRRPQLAASWMQLREIRPPLPQRAALRRRLLIWPKKPPTSLRWRQRPGRCLRAGPGSGAAVGLARSRALWRRPASERPCRRGRSARLRVPTADPAGAAARGP